MANKEIANLPAATTPLDGSELVHVVQGGNSRKGTTALLAALAKAVQFISQTLTSDEQAQARANIGMEYGLPMLHVVDQKASGNAGGTNTGGGAAQQRTLNTVRTNRIAGASLASSAITLPAGTYYCEGRAPGVGIGRHKVYLRNDTDSVAIILGSSEFSGVNPGSGNVSTNSEVSGEFTLAASKAVSLYHITEIANATIGLGVANSFGVTEVYSELKIWRLK